MQRTGRREEGMLRPGGPGPLAETTVVLDHRGHNREPVQRYNQAGTPSAAKPIANDRPALGSSLSGAPSCAGEHGAPSVPPPEPARTRLHGAARYAAKRTRESSRSFPRRELAERAHGAP